MGTAVFTDAEELKKEVRIDVTPFLNFTTGEGKRFAGTLFVECRYDVGLEDRCGGRCSPEAASTSGAQDLLGLGAANAAPLLFSKDGDPTPADDAPMAEWDPAPTTSS